MAELGLIGRRESFARLLRPWNDVARRVAGRGIRSKSTLFKARTERRMERDCGVVVPQSARRPAGFHRGRLARLAAAMSSSPVRYGLGALAQPLSRSVYRTNGDWSRRPNFSRRPTMAANVFWEAAYVDARLPIEWRSGAGLTFCCPSFVAISRGDMKRPTSAASQRECFKSHARCGGRAQRQLIAGVQRLGRLQKNADRTPLVSLARQSRQLCVAKASPERRPALPPHRLSSAVDNMGMRPALPKRSPV